MIMKNCISIRKRCIYIVFLMATFFLMFTAKTVYADDAKISISTTQATQGDEVRVTVSVNADKGIGECNFILEYNSDIIEISEKQDDTGLMYNGGGGSVHIQYGVSNTKDVKININFKAKSPGITEIKYVTISEDSGVLSYDSMEWMNVSNQNGSVTVKAPYVASKDNYLTNLKVEAVKNDGSTYTLELSPKFSKDVTKYNAKAVEGVTKLVVTADKSDSKATVKMAGRAMDPGDNTTTITVTAEDGSTRKYVIYTYVEKKPETTTPPPEPIVIQIDGTDMHIKDIDENVKLPEGFEKINYEYKGNKVVAAKGLVKNLMVMYVAKSDGSSGQLYIYDESGDSFYPMSNLQLTQKLYTIVKEPQDLIIPAGYVETTVTIDEQNFKGWSNSEVENIYLVYAMNWNGEKGLYYYDTNEKQIIRYFDVTIEVGADTGVELDDYNNLVSQNENLKDEINKLKAENTNDEADSVKLYKYLALGCCIMAVIYLGIIIYLVVSRKKTKADETESEEVTTDGEEAEEDTQDGENVAEETDNEKSVDEIVESTETVDEEDISDQESVEIKTAEDSNNFSDKIKEENEVERTDELEDATMDFEAIITAETVAAITDEISESNDKVEVSEELTPEIKVETKSSDADSEKKKKVAQIMDDDDSSIDSDDLDMVIDELFDDLFD